MPTYEELYDKQLEAEKAENPEVDFLLDTNEEEVDWLRPKEEG